MLADTAKGLADIRQGLMCWRMWLTLAWNDVRRRYRRSGLGQFWLTLSMATMVGGLGFVYSNLFRVDVTKYLPYIAVTFVFWGVISSLVNESCNAFIENDNMLRHMYLPRSLFIFRVIARTLIIAAHNVLIIPVVFVYFSVGLNLNILWLVPGLALVLANGFWFGFFLAIVGARFRDVPQILTSIMQVVFFVTPIMFLPEQLARRGIAVLKWNPFANLLEVVCNPILGMHPSKWALTSCLVMAIVGFLIVLPFAGRYAPRAVYWL
jgi:ABC-type polysaccharide/polyol phosphate export permease